MQKKTAHLEDKSVNFWIGVFFTLLVAAFFTGMLISGIYYSVKANKEIQRAVDMVFYEYGLDTHAKLTPELQHFMKQYNITGKKHNGSDDLDLKICKRGVCSQVSGTP